MKSFIMVATFWAVALAVSGYPCTNPSGCGPADTNPMGHQTYADTNPMGHQSYPNTNPSSYGSTNNGYPCTDPSGCRTYADTNPGGHQTYADTNPSSYGNGNTQYAYPSPNRVARNECHQALTKDSCLLYPQGCLWNDGTNS